MYPNSHMFWYFISQFMIWSLTFLHTCIQVKALTTYLLRSWVITLPKFSSCSLVVMRKEGKELVIFQTWSKKKKLLAILALLFAKSQQWERWQLVKLPIVTITNWWFCLWPPFRWSNGLPIVCLSSEAGWIIDSLYCHHQPSSNLSDKF